MTFHRLRHTYASLLIDADVHPKALQVRLGHASSAETMDTYRGGSGADCVIGLNDQGLDQPGMVGVVVLWGCV